MRTGESLGGSLPRQLVAGLVLGAMGISLALSLAALVFTGDLSPHLGRGAGWVLVGMVAIGTVTALTSSFPGLAAGPQDAPAVVVAAAATGLVANTQEPIATLAAFVIVSTGLTGLIMVLIGRFRLGALVRFVPFPVVAGFLGGTGVVLLMAGIDILNGTGTLADELGLRLVPGLVIGLLIVWFGRRGGSPAITAVLITGAFAGHHLVSAMAGISPGEGVARGLLLGPFPDGDLLDLGVAAQLLSVDWGSLATQAPAIIVMALLVPMGLLLNTGALEHTFKTDIDVDHELMATGVGLLAAAPFAGLPGYVFMGNTVIGRRIAGANRLPPLIAAGLALVVVVVGTDLISLVPVIIPGGLLLAIGMDLILSWVWDIRDRVGLVEHLVIVAIVVTVATLGFIQGVGLGLVAATVLFVVRYSRIPAVRSMTTARDRRSNVQRSATDNLILNQIGDRVVVVELQGFLFFGTAEQIVRIVCDAVRLQPDARTVVIDLRRVTGLDSSAHASFARLRRFAHEQDLEVVLSGARTQDLTSLESVLAEGFRHEIDLDHALENCEDDLLAAVAGSRGQGPATDGAEAEVVDLWSQLPRRRLSRGHAIVSEGALDSGLFLLEEGRASVRTEDATQGARHALLLPGSVIGELSLLSGRPANATVVCDTDCVVRHLPTEMVTALALEDPVRGLALEHFIATRLADKLDAANRTIRSLS